MGVQIRCLVKYSNAERSQLVDSTHKTDGIHIALQRVAIAGHSECAVAQHLPPACKLCSSQPRGITCTTQHAAAQQAAWLSPSVHCKAGAGQRSAVWLTATAGHCNGRVTAMSLIKTIAPSISQPRHKHPQPSPLLPQSLTRLHLRAASSIQYPSPQRPQPHLEQLVHPSEQGAQVLLASS